MLERANLASLLLPFLVRLLGNLEVSSFAAKEGARGRGEAPTSTHSRTMPTDQPLRSVVDIPEDQALHQPGTRASVERVTGSICMHA